MMTLILALEAAQNGNSIFYSRLAHEYRLEAARKSAILIV